MSILTVLTYPDPFLKTVADPVVTFDDSLRTLVHNMFETMYDEKGIGLAATQVGENKRLFTMDAAYSDESSQDKQAPLAIINPVVIQTEGEQLMEEGCLSVPEYRSEIQRFAFIKIEYQDLEQNFQHIEAAGLEAVCIQHEMDHLEGKLFIEYLPRLKRAMIQKRLRKISLKND
ncbi:MAG: peptide deformylase [Proteobacteria bacterium]|nr:peptide deformylase [Pseudomonadota bacterium]